MSYSVCFKCREMVSAYEKYCKSCAPNHKQDKNFYKTFSYSVSDEERQKQIEADKINASNT